MHDGNTALTQGVERRFLTSLAQSAADVRAAQRLRYRVYSEELKAALPERAAAIDRDEFDAHCDHLLVRDAATGEVVGTSRMLGAEQAYEAGGFYSETEFDLRRVLARIATSRACLVEVGRACVHPDYRRGGVVALLLAGLTHYLVARRCEYLIGCASVSAADDVQLAARICARLTREYLAPAEWRVFPREPFFSFPVGNGPAPVPPLIKGYLRLGAYVCGDPAWDESFKTADLLLLLPMTSMSPRHRARLLREPVAA